jgi:hypothetical protein
MEIIAGEIYFVPYAKVLLRHVARQHVYSREGWGGAPPCGWSVNPVRIKGQQFCVTNLGGLGVCKGGVKANQRVRQERIVSRPKRFLQI